MIGCAVRAPATMLTTEATGMRSPWIQETPPITLGFTVILSTHQT